MLTLAGLLLAVLAPAVSSQDYTPDSPGATMEGTAEPGGTVTFTGTTEADAEVQALLDLEGSPPPQVLGSTVANDEGDFSLAVAIPTDLPAGLHTLSLVAAGQVLSSTTLAVGANGQGAGSADSRDDDASGALPMTGATSGILLTVGLGVVAAGGAAVAASRRAKSSTV